MALTGTLQTLDVVPVDKKKTGKREAAWAIMFITLILTLMDYVTAAFLGPDETRDLTTLLIVIWPSALGNLAFAYKLDTDVRQKPAATPDEGPAPEDYGV